MARHSGWNWCEHETRVCLWLCHANNKWTSVDSVKPRSCEGETGLFLEPVLLDRWWWWWWGGCTWTSFLFFTEVNIMCDILFKGACYSDHKTLFCFCLDWYTNTDFRHISNLRVINGCHCPNFAKMYFWGYCNCHTEDQTYEKKNIKKIERLSTYYWTCVSNFKHFCWLVWKWGVLVLRIFTNPQN